MPNSIKSIMILVLLMVASMGIVSAQMPAYVYTTEVLNQGNGYYGIVVTALYPESTTKISTEISVSEFIGGGGNQWIGHYLGQADFGSSDGPKLGGYDVGKKVIAKVSNLMTGVYLISDGKVRAIVTLGYPTKEKSPSMVGNAYLDTYRHASRSLILGIGTPEPKNTTSVIAYQSLETDERIAHAKIMVEFSPTDKNNSIVRYLGILDVKTLLDAPLVVVIYNKETGICTTDFVSPRNIFVGE